MRISHFSAHPRCNNGQDHCYWSRLEKVRSPHGQWGQRPILSRGEINDSPKAAWIKTIEVFDADRQAFLHLALFPRERTVPAPVTEAGQGRRAELTSHRPRHGGACWVACLLGQQLQLDAFGSQPLAANREGRDWKINLQVLTICRLLNLGRQGRLHRQWGASPALGELLGLHLPGLDKDALYRCLDRLRAPRPALFQLWRARGQDLFGAQLDGRLSDLTSTYWERDPPFPEGDQRRLGYSRAKRPDCGQVMLALIVTPEGYPLASEGLPGTIRDKTPRKAFRAKTATLSGKAPRVGGTGRPAGRWTGAFQPKRRGRPGAPANRRFNTGSARPKAA